MAGKVYAPWKEVREGVLCLLHINWAMFFSPQMTSLSQKPYNQVWKIKFFISLDVMPKPPSTKGATTSNFDVSLRGGDQDRHQAP